MDNHNFMILFTETGITTVVEQHQEQMLVETEGSQESVISIDSVGGSS